MQPPVVDRYEVNETAGKVNKLLGSQYDAPTCEAAIADGKVAGYVIQPGVSHFHALASNIRANNVNIPPLDEAAVARIPTEVALTVSNLLGSPIDEKDGKLKLVALHNYKTLPEAECTFVAPEVFEAPENMAVIEANAALIRDAREGRPGCRVEAKQIYTARTGKEINL